MKKTSVRLLLTWLMLGSGIALHAQYENGTAMTPEERLRTQSARTEAWRTMQEKKVEAIVVSSSAFKNGKPKHGMRLSSKQVISTEGQTIAYENYTPKGKLSFKTGFTYDDHGHVVERVSRTPHGRCLDKYKSTYADELLMQSQVLRGNKERLHSRTEYAYDATGRLTGSHSFRGKQGKLSGYSTYAYYEDGSKKRAENYNRRDKLLSVTDYACDQAGKVLAKDQVRERIVCERIEHAENGEELRVVETLAEDNGTERSVSKFNSRNYMVDFTKYDAAGTVKVHWIYGYDDKGHLLTSERRTEGDKLETRSEYTRNEQGLATTEVVSNGEGEVLMKLAYSYSFY